MLPTRPEAWLIRSWRAAGSELLRRSLAVSTADAAICEAELHVHTANAAAVAFYKRNGFEIVETVPYHYPQLQPSSAYLLRRALQPCALAQQGEVQSD